MKLICATLALASSAFAFNVDTFVEDTLSKIYQEKPDGFVLDLSPYFKVDVSDLTENSHKAVGYLSSGDGNIDFSAELDRPIDGPLKYTISQGGTFKSFP